MPIGGVRARTSGIMVPAFVAPVTATYTGPGDILSGALGWWGLRAYNQAAIGTKNAVRLRAADTTEQNFGTVSGGGLDMTSINSFISTHGACTVVTLFDQSGNSVDVTQGTTANQPTFTQNAVGTLPGVTFDGTNDALISATNIAQASPYSYSLAADGRDLSAFGYIMASNADDDVIGPGSANNIRMQAVSGFNASANNNTFHRVQAQFNGASSILFVDAVTTNGDVGAPQAMSGTFALGGYTSGGLTKNCVILEAGCWGGNNSGSFASLDTNQSVYWGI